MMRLPHFRYHVPSTVAEAARILAAEGPTAMLLAGGTDLLPNMKRRHQVPESLVALAQLRELRERRTDGGLSLGAALTLTELVHDLRVREGFTALWQAAVQVATPHLRNMGTLGGNLCLDTRCTYYDQSYEWRQAIGFCLKKDGETCWVAPSSPRCLAVSSTDTAPALIALGARVLLVAAGGSREIALEDLYANDGIGYLTRRPDEVLTEVRLDERKGWRSAYWKLRRRGAFDFPVLSVAVAGRLGERGGVEELRIALGAAASRPLLCEEAARATLGRELTDDVIAETAGLAARLAKPMDNTDFTLHWRKRVTTHFVAQALRELRGDDVRAERRRIARHDLASAWA